MWMRGHCADDFFKSTQSNIILLLEKKGNHGNDILQAGESLDRHAFLKAPFVSSWKMDVRFQWVHIHSCRQRRLEHALCPMREKAGKKTLLRDLKYRLLHSLHIKPTLKYHAVLVESDIDACTALSLMLSSIAHTPFQRGYSKQAQYGLTILRIDFLFPHRIQQQWRSVTAAFQARDFRHIYNRDW